MAIALIAAEIKPPGAIVYDAFVLDNKVKAIYYQAQPTSTDADEDADKETT
nr:hypothetical protein [uncultured Dysosmobacter sp.]